MTQSTLDNRRDQMFPVLSETEIGRIRRFGEVRRFPAGEFLFQAGQVVSGMHVILSGRVAIVPRDGLGQTVVKDLDVSAICRSLTFRNFDIGTTDTTLAGVVWAFLRPIELPTWNVDTNTDTPFPSVPARARVALARVN